ncbi:MAG: response regulator transcription factor [Coriobacteriales bacterium]|nr:response regulator transcription factor [Coriobacteriales bacterium]
MAAKLLLAEDTRDLNRALVTVLEHEGYDVVPAYDGEEALHYVELSNFDGVILDIMMPKVDGLEVLSRMRSDGNYTPVLLLTAKAEVDDRVLGLDAGADDYLTKPFAMKELLARVRSITRRQQEYSNQRLVFGDITLDAQEFELSAGNAVRLSVKEFELMQTLVMNDERALSCGYLLGRIWKGEDDAHDDTVRLYVSYLRGKLKWIGSRVIIAESADGYRLRFVEDKA